MILLAAVLAATLSRESLTGIHQQSIPGVRTAQDGEVVTIAVDGVARRVRCTIKEERPLERIAYFHDVETGTLLKYEPLYFTGQPARVFRPNPVVALNYPPLQDQNDAASAVPDAAYSIVTVDATGPMAGPNVVIVNLSAPATPIPDASGSLFFNRQDDGFEDVHAYYHIDANQKYLQSLGYVGARRLVAYPIPVDPHGANGSDNSFFVPAAALGRGSLQFGDGGTDDAEDADLIIHEYGHAILEWIAPGTFGGAFSSQSRAMGEGFGDYWAFSAHYQERAASGRDPFCFADWDTRCWLDDSSERCSYPPGTDCLRRLDSPNTMANYSMVDFPGTEHRNGTIWSSALREIFLVAGKRTTDILVLESFFGTPPNPTFAGIARRMLDVDRLMFAGAHVAAICGAMSKRGILTDCGAPPRGELTHFQSPRQGVAIPELDATGITTSLTIDDPRAIDALFVRVDINHTARGDLRIVLIAPDGEEIELQTVSSDRTADVHATFGLDVEPEEPLDVLRGRSAAGVWRLRVSDTRIRDVGTLQSWGLVIRFAGDVPRVERPNPEGRRQVIPVVAHVTTFRSELRLFSAAGTTATLTFTPSGADGRTVFAATNVRLAAGQVVQFDDVVSTLFGSVGGGSIEIIGDVVASSRTYTGNYGQLIPAMNGAALPLYVPLVVVDDQFRTNIGFTETAGRGGRVRLRYADVVEEFTIAPYEHVQVPARASGVAVLEGDCGTGLDFCPNLIGYASIIDNSSNDPMFVPAVRLPAAGRRAIAPVIRAPGANGTVWMSDVWRTNLVTGTVDYARDAADDGLAVRLLELPAGVVAGSRTWTPGSYGQYVPFATPTSATKQLLHVEQSSARRTNVGLLTDEGGVARVIVYDSAGVELTRSEHVLGALQVVQFPVLTPVVDGRVMVEVLSGRVYGYVSVIDNLSGDPLYVPGP
ncbi:MAG TPA: proprotein convertase P-domain-containing protein [Thermoanaerobaculia bacterium]|jgi:subtilisin-like proprotein convertase family protein